MWAALQEKEATVLKTRPVQRRRIPRLIPTATRHSTVYGPWPPHAKIMLIARLPTQALKKEHLVQRLLKISTSNDHHDFLGVVPVVLLLEDVGADVVVDVGADEVARLKLLLMMIWMPVMLPLVTPMIPSL